jgi:hypothetical protein
MYLFLVNIVRGCLFSIFICSLCLADNPYHKPETIDLIIVAGQSNAVGFDTFVDQLPPSPIDQDVHFWWRCGAPPPDSYDSTSDNQWLTLTTQPQKSPNQDRLHRSQSSNFHHLQGGFGPEIGLARTLRRLQPQQPLAVIKVAFNGTSITAWLSRPQKDEFNCYTALICEIKKALTQALEKGIIFHLRALVWVQGESDGNEVYAADYKNNLLHMIKTLKKDLDAPDLIVLLGFNTKFKNGCAAVRKVVKAQKDIAQQDIHITYVDSSECELANGVHFSSKGTLKLGRLFGRKLLQTEKILASSTKR